MIKKLKQTIHDYFYHNAKDTTEFLPSALAIQETPPHPAPRILLWGIIIFIFGVFLWAVIGKTEIVAIADGVIISNDKSQTIQVFEHATVRKIHVRDGSYIHKNDVLLELDHTRPQADLDSIAKEIIFYKAQLLRNHSFLNALQHNHVPVLEETLDIPLIFFQKTQEQLTSDYQNIQSKLKENRTKIHIINQEITSYNNTVSEKKKLLDVKTKRLNNYKELSKHDFIPKNRYLEIQEDVLTLKASIRNLADLIAEKNAHIANLQSEANVIIENAKNITTKESQEATQKMTILEEDLKKAQNILDTTKIIAPVSGTVQQLSVNTVGGVLTPAQPVMVIVPNDAPLEAEVTFLNKDIGFIEVGQNVHIKIESFPYTKYGMIDGIVSVVSGDAIQDEKLGLVYKGRIKLEKSAVHVGKKDIRLVPGMRVTAEIKTDEKRLIDYFLSPLITNTTEAFR